MTRLLHNMMTGVLERAQLRLVVYPFIYRVSYMSGGAGFLLSTVLTQQTI